MLPSSPFPRNRESPTNEGMTASERIVITSRDHLELQAWRAPAPSPGEVRIRVAYSAVSFGDVMLRRHVFRPRPAVAVPGYEVVGTIDAVGGGGGRVRRHAHEDVPKN